MFNRDITKQAIGVIFSTKKKKAQHPELVFNGIPVSREENTKYLGVYLDSGLNFSKHVSGAVIKATKGISFLKYISRKVTCRINCMPDPI